MADDHDIVLMAVMFSDSAIREWGTGKMSFIGSFHTYQSAIFPFAIPPFIVTPFLTNIRGKLTKPLAIAVRIEDPRTGNILANTVGQLGMQPEYTFSGSEVVDVPFFIPPIQFQNPGNYAVIVMVDGERKGERVLPVISVTAAPQLPKT